MASYKVKVINCEDVTVNGVAKTSIGDPMVSANQVIFYNEIGDAIAVFNRVISCVKIEQETK